MAKKTKSKNPTANKVVVVTIDNDNLGAFKTRNAAMLCIAEDAIDNFGYKIIEVELK